MPKKIKILPKKPSKLIRLALKDLRAAEKAGAIIDMGWWLAKREKVDGGPKVCVVCFAGAVMKNTLGLRPNEPTRQYPAGEICPSAEYTPGNVKQLEALNDFRAGDILSGCQTLGISERRIKKLPENLATNYWEGHCSYDASKDYFYTSMKKMARRLAYYGL